MAKHTQLLARIFSGDEWGERTRRDARLDRYDEDPHTRVFIVLPTDTLCLSSSFIRGMLGPSVRALGNECYAKFHVVAGAEKSEYFNQVIRTELEELLAGPSEFRRAVKRRAESGKHDRSTDADHNNSSWY